MSKICKVTVHDEVWCHLTGLRPEETQILTDAFAPHVEGYFFQPKYKLGVWDGRIRFFQAAGKTYNRLLDQILPYVEKWGYDIEIVDKRKSWKSPELSEVSITKVDAGGIAIEAEGLDLFGPVELAPGHQIKLRPYQLQCVKLAVEAGSGFIVAGTGSGKCVSGDTLINIRVSPQLKQAIENIRSKNLSHLPDRK